MLVQQVTAGDCSSVATDGFIYLFIAGGVVFVVTGVLFVLFFWWGGGGGGGDVCVCVRPERERQRDTLIQ